VFSLHAHALISGGLFIVMILFAVAGNALTSSGTVKDLGSFQTPAVEDQQPHDAKTRGEEGRLWLKGDIIVEIEGRRMDDLVEGEDAATAGQWIQYIDLSLRKDYPWIERYVFAPSQE
jgi:hypothetical protein